MTETVAGLARTEFGDDTLPREWTAAGLPMAVPPIAYSPWPPAITASYPLGAQPVKNRYPDRPWPPCGPAAPAWEGESQMTVIGTVAAVGEARPDGKEHFGTKGRKAHE